jgi:hypothetical protein
MNQRTLKAQLKLNQWKFHKKSFVQHYELLRKKHNVSYLLNQIK